MSLRRVAKKDTEGGPPPTPQLDAPMQADAARAREDSVHDLASTSAYAGDNAAPPASPAPADARGGGGGASALAHRGRRRARRRLRTTGGGGGDGHRSDSLADVRPDIYQI